MFNRNSSRLPRKLLSAFLSGPQANHTNSKYPKNGSMPLGVCVWLFGFGVGGGKGREVGGGKPLKLLEP